jgi:hypothetical protein
MALITDPNITSQISALANSGQVDTNALVSLLNSVLPTSQQIATSTGGVTTGIYKQFGTYDTVNAKVEVVTTGLWSGDSGSLYAFYTSSAGTATSNINSEYYWNVYETNPQADSSAEVQFALAYGHINGSGSMTLDLNNNSVMATKATYFQYRSLLLEAGITNFPFQNNAGGTTDSNDIYVINVARNRYRESMDAGNWSLTLSGSNGVFTFIDDSGKKFSDTAGKTGTVFNVVSGSLNLGTQNAATIQATTDTTTGLGFGLFFPAKGIIVLNPKAIGSTLGTVKVNGGASANVSGSLSTAAEQYNQKLLYQALVNGANFEARRTENVHTQHYFVRATNREFNYSNNPTYVNADGTFMETTFNTDPYTYITTVGLYTDANELVAVAKTSQPLPKSFDKEVLIKVKLSF